MAIKFRLSYNTGLDYTDLLPQTAIDNIEGADTALSYSEVRFTIPAFKGLEQTIAMTLTDRQAVAPFDLRLVDETPSNLVAYYTLDQISASKDGFKIIRLGAGSKKAIEVIARFKEAGV